MLIAITVSSKLSKQCNNPFIAGCIDPQNVATRLGWGMKYNMETSLAAKLTEEHDVVFWTRDKSGLSLVAEYADIKTPGRRVFKRKHTKMSDAIGVDLLDVFDPFHRHEDTFANNCAGVALGLLMFVLGATSAKHIFLATLDHLATLERTHGEEHPPHTIEDLYAFGLVPVLMLVVTVVESLLQIMSTINDRAHRIMGVANNSLSREMRAQGILHTLIETWAANPQYEPTATGIARDILAELMQTIDRKYIYDWIMNTVKDDWNGTNCYALVPCDPTKSAGQIVVSDYESICEMYKSVFHKDLNSESELHIGACLQELNEQLVARENICPFTRGPMTGKTYRESGAQWIKLSDISKEVLQPYFPGRQLASFTDVAAHSC